MKKIFIKWLKYNKCYKKYMYYYNKQNTYSLNNLSCEYYMLGFIWSNAKEGYNYWRELHYKWNTFNEHIKKINNKYYYCKYICKLEKL